MLKLWTITYHDYINYINLDIPIYDSANSMPCKYIYISMNISIYMHIHTNTMILYQLINTIL